MFRGHDRYLTQEIQVTNEKNPVFSEIKISANENIHASFYVTLNQQTVCYVYVWVLTIILGIGEVWQKSYPKKY